MPRRLIKFVKGEFYHIYNRGAEKQKIFYDSDNYLHFHRLLKKYVTEFTVAAYCLMANHFHFLLRLDGNEDFSQCMSNMLNSYVQALNNKYNRSGPLFADSC